MRGLLSPILLICWSPVPFISESCSTNIDDGADKPSGCSCSSVAPRPSVLALQSRRKGRDLSITAPQSRKTSIGGAASSASRARTASSIEGVKLNVAPFLSKAVIGRTRLAMLAKNLR